ncbi:chromosome segregation protein [Novipirellula aureliae]|uniref:Chromosome segregation protein n=1 Tax=Novipirellula aureliae TaxID=2527966 RepID=A0A5C6E4X3_9BACT|nr:YhaN family protein [Novipirellula aureliae]TWU43735.1 chromosome segregation protein [Novipirellula aureliae]
MRIRQLDLIRIGPFNNQTLSFEQGDFGLHLVYGPNEAGKSSTLRALTHWLFGFPGETKSRDHFQHAYKNLRVGGTIEDHDGETLTCVRRHGGQKSLRGENDKGALDPAVLSAFLCGLTQQQFQTQFGIDSKQLVEGGKTIAKGGGELGESLFAAGSGSANMPGLRSSLDSQCDHLFKPSTATKPQVNAAISAFNAARKEVRELSVKSNDWKRQAEELEELRAEKVELDKAQIKCRGRRDRSDRILKALPLIGTLKDKERELEEVGHVARLSDDFVTRRVTVTEGLANAKTSHKTTSDELESLNAKLEKLGQPPMILEHASEVESLFEDLSLYRQALRVLPDQRAEFQQCESRAISLLKTLGKEPDLHNADGLRIKPATRAKIRDLADQRSERLTTVEKTKRDLDKKNRDLDAVLESIAQLDEPDDPKRLKRAVADAQNLGDIDSRIDQLAKSLTTQQSEMEAELNRLPMWSGGIEELRQRSVPTTEMVDSLADQFASNARSIEKLEGNIRDLKDELARANEDLHALTLNQDVPSEEQLENARNLRDRALETTEQIARTGVPDRLLHAIEDLRSRLETCDEIADRLRREANLVRDKARFIATIKRCETRITDRADELRRCEADRQKLSSRWLDIWQAAGILPDSSASMPTPTEMKNWLVRYEKLVANTNELERTKAELRAEQQKRQQAIDSMVAIDPSSNRECCKESERISPILDACRDRIEQVDTVIAKAKQLENRRQDLLNERDSAESLYEEAKAEKDIWQTEWGNAMLAIEGDGSLSANEARAVLETIDKLTSELKNAAKLRDDVQNRTAEIQSYEASVRELYKKLNDNKEDVSEINVEAIVSQWHDQLKRTRNIQTTRDEWLLQHRHFEKQQREAAAKMETLTASLKQLCSEAGCDHPDQLPEIERMSLCRQTIEQSVSEIKSELRGLAHGVELETFVAEAMKEDADQLAPQIQQLDEEHTKIEARRQELWKTILGKENDLDRIDGNDRAAAANERAEEALARARTHAEDYIRAKLGSILLRTAVTRYRQRNQGPILSRASELFSRFTLGSFSGLEADSTDQEDNVLVGVRGDDATKLVHVDEMSEGTCDQLFLALRLASLEVYLQSNPPFPFIVDDILSNFDDARAAATFAALAELSTKTQVILLTHHQHLVDIAKGQVSDNVLFVHSLNRL